MRVIDTKWKVPKNGRPDSADLKQMYCYHELFETRDATLLYPSPNADSYFGTQGKFTLGDNRLETAFVGFGPELDDVLREVLAVGR